MEPTIPSSSDLTPREADEMTARLHAEVGLEHIATVYAQALLGAAEKQGQTAAVHAELDALVTEVLDGFPRFAAILASPRISPEDLSSILERTLAGRVGPLLLVFLKVLARHGRLDCLRAVRGQFHRLYDALAGRVQVRVTTAVPLDAAVLSSLEEMLRRKLGREPVVRQVTDPDLIGGVVVQVGDTLYDASVARQLETLRLHMIDRSIHEIQSRRDRFRNSAGN
jgi:F-type H+-transporting ATPase subunit delta